MAAMLNFWRHQRARTLRWDGECWFVGAPVEAVEMGGEGAQVLLRLDAQRWMLLWFQPASGARGCWLWAQARNDPARWHLLRCALYSPLTSASAGSTPAAETERA
ncbi:hypothetical protein [Ottowia testudinis]|uniref:Uncharacterized protein n=1 Tax=Ottowia testudinis TaxID=2816950 RepID=A0A975H263_9BURK|nr:hypothetical protein [Ottowia testudinis]QTD43861.1 hypothetical protein J1M35_11970 [Ottowia testudinis]